MIKRKQRNHNSNGMVITYAFSSAAVVAS